MRLPSFLQRKDRTRASAASAAADEGQAVHAARAQARRRLIGAVVLLGIGIVGFPLIFETQPRPLAGDIPIEIVGKAPATLPATTSPAALPAQPPVPEPVSEPASAATIVERPADAGIEVPPPKPASHPEALVAPSARAVAASAPTSPTSPAVAAPKAAAGPAKSDRAVAASVPAAVPKPQPAVRVASAPTPAHDDGARAQALLDGESKASAGQAVAAAPASSAGTTAPAASAPGRYVVQVGAYTDATALREARQKVEHLGLKTYTQEVESDAGKRTRVRVGPFATRKEAEAVAAKLKAAGLPTGLLTL